MITEKIRNPLSLFDVRDKVAIITGASGSFGHACAVALGALGAKLLLASGTAEELEAVVNDVRDVGGKVASIVAPARYARGRGSDIEGGARRLRPGRSVGDGFRHQ